jgi:hypothetical protein
MLIIHDFFPEFFGHFLTKKLGQILENFVFLVQIQLILLVLETAQILFLKTLQVIVLEDVHFFLIVLYKSHIPKASEGNVFTFFF